MVMNVFTGRIVLFIYFSGLQISYGDSECDVRQWYLKQSALGTFDGELTFDQYSVQSMVEDLILKSKSDPKARFVDCNILLQYDDLLKQTPPPVSEQSKDVVTTEDDESEIDESEIDETEPSETDVESNIDKISQTKLKYENENQIPSDRQQEQTSDNFSRIDNINYTEDENEKEKILNNEEQTQQTDTLSNSMKNQAKETDANVEETKILNEDIKPEISVDDTDVINQKQSQEFPTDNGLDETKDTNSMSTRSEDSRVENDELIKQTQSPEFPGNNGFDERKDTDSMSTGSDDSRVENGDVIKQTQSPEFPGNNGFDETKDADSMSTTSDDSRVENDDVMYNDKSDMNKNTDNSIADTRSHIKNADKVKTESQEYSKEHDHDRNNGELEGAHVYVDRTKQFGYCRIKESAIVDVFDMCQTFPLEDRPENETSRLSDNKHVCHMKVCNYVYSPSACLTTLVSSKKYKENMSNDSHLSDTDEENIRFEKENVKTSSSNEPTSYVESKTDEYQNQSDDKDSNVNQDYRFQENNKEYEKDNLKKNEEYQNNDDIQNKKENTVNNNIHIHDSARNFNEKLNRQSDEYSAKLQTLELTLMKLENQVLMEKLDKQNHTATITRLENQILKLENELLKINQSYHTIKSENEAMDKRQRKYLELGHSGDSEPQEITHYEIISKQQAKITQLKEILQNQTSTINKINARSDYLEDQNRMLYQMIMNQTTLMSQIMTRVQALTEENIKQREEARKLKQQMEEKNVERKFEEIKQKVDRESISNRLLNQLDYMTMDNQEINMKEVPSVSSNVKANDIGLFVRTKRVDLIQISDMVYKWCGYKRNIVCLSGVTAVVFCPPYSAFKWMQCEIQQTNGQKDPSVPTTNTENHLSDGYKDSTNNNMVNQASAPITPSTNEYKSQKNLNEEDISKKISEDIVPTKTDSGNERAVQHEDQKLTDTKIPIHGDKFNEKMNVGISSEEVENINKDDIQMVSPIQQEKESRESKSKVESTNESGFNGIQNPDQEQQIQKHTHHIDHKKATEKNGDHIKTAEQHVAQKQSVNNQDKDQKQSTDTNQQNADQTQNQKQTSHQQQTKQGETLPLTAGEHPQAQHNEQSVKLAKPKVEPHQQEQQKQNQEQSHQKQNQQENSQQSSSNTNNKSGSQKLVDKKPLLYSSFEQKDPKDCYDHYITRGSRKNGAYRIKPKGQKATIEVFCDMKNGGWTILQKRQDGTTNFFREWEDYKNGFGGVYGEHWIGLDTLHQMTNQDYYTLRIDMTDWNKETRHANYGYFIVDSENEGYKLHIGEYSGDAGDGMVKHHQHKFSTKDVDNDKVVKEFGGSCAKRFTGAWWYYKCYMSNLNGKYYRNGKIEHKKFDGITWKPWTGPNYSLKIVEMKIRPNSVDKNI